MTPSPRSVLPTPNVAKAQLGKSANDSIIGALGLCANTLSQQCNCRALPGTHAIFVLAHFGRSLGMILSFHRLVWVVHGSEALMEASSSTLLSSHMYREFMAAPEEKRVRACQGSNMFRAGCIPLPPLPHNPLLEP